MSNAVDILLCDGPMAGLRMCQPRPVPSTIVATDSQEPADYTYYTVAYQDLYWVAVVDAEDLSAVDAMIAATGWEPSWDLLRAQGQHP